MLNILIVNIAIAFAFSFIVFKLIIPNIPENFKKKVNENLDSFIFTIIIKGGIFLFLFLPLVFKTLAINVWGIPTLIDGEGGGSRPLQLFDLGPLGDIYGSLNTLFTSVTLGIVAYTAGLQRKANEHTFNAAEAQLQLAQKNHQEQLKETQNSIFLSVFTTLLSQKNITKENLQFKGETGVNNHEHFFRCMSTAFEQKLKNEWSDLKDIDQDKVFSEFLKSASECGEETHLSAILTTYFYIYESIITLIEKSKMTDSDKDFYFEIVRNTMSLDEQITLLWLSGGMEHVNGYLNNSHIFWFNYQDAVKFILKFHNSTQFSNPKMLELWSDK